jgi:hypothetical protein
MKRTLLLLLLIAFVLFGNAQKIDSISFHLYTDSLKKGTHNYINVDGMTANKKWIPLTEKEIIFSTSYGAFEGNDLVLDSQPPVEKVLVRATLKSNPQTWKEINIWIKIKPDDELLPMKNDSQEPSPRSKKNNRKKNSTN